MEKRLTPKNYMTELEIKKAKLPRDLKILEQLDTLSFPEYQDQIYKESWEKYQNYIVFVNKKPVGYRSVQPHTGLYDYATDTHEKKREALHLTSVGIIPRFRRKGLGTLLITWAIAYARLGKFESMNATCRKSNKPIIALLKKTGFKITSEIKNFYPDGETAVVEEYFLKKSRF
ncbi:GNAT family N-acetyltransferase [Patescibacteria group bacterium]|nr:GNAT family N-acetyltransferase [Patescibacteria group bacterium]